MRRLALLLCVLSTLIFVVSCRSRGEKVFIDDNGNRVDEESETGARIGDTTFQRLVTKALEEFRDKYGSENPIDPLRVGFYRIENRTSEPIPQSDLDFTREQVWDEVVDPRVFQLVARQYIQQGLIELGFADVQELLTPAKIQAFRDVMYQDVGQPIHLLIFGSLTSRGEAEDASGSFRTRYAFILQVVNLRTGIQEENIRVTELTEYRR